MPRLVGIPLSALAVTFLLGGGVPARAENIEPVAPPPAESANRTPPSDAPAEPKVDFEHEKTFIDISDAVRSKQYVHRAILTNLIRDTSQFYIPHFYINHMAGFSSVWQRAGAYTKYSTGQTGVSVGYVTPFGHGVELGLELSNVSNLYLGYRYFIRPQKFSLWGFVGGGYGFEVKSLSFSDGPYESRFYNGPKNMGFLTFGLLVPIVDVGIKAEIRACFYDFDRIVFTQGVGIIVFL